jgi:hypothetical protein
VSTTKEIVKFISSEIDGKYEYAVNQSGLAILIDKQADQNLVGFQVKSQHFKKNVRKIAIEYDLPYSDKIFRQVQSNCIDQAFLSDRIVDTYLRVAPLPAGVELDVGSVENTRIRIAAGEVEIINSGSDVLFLRSPSMQPFVEPALGGDISLLFHYLNFDKTQSLLLIGWLSFVLAHAKEDTTSFPILVLIADQGSGKSFLSKVIIRSLTDPSMLGIQGFPNSKQDMLLATQHAHVQIYDNLTYINKSWSNTLCIMSTGGNLSGRQLFTDSDIVNHKLHAPLVLNGISNFITTSDLAQRCLTLELNPLTDRERKSEKQLLDDFNQNLPSIFGGLCQLTADIFKVLPDVEVTHRERMIDFSSWLAALEQVMDLPKSQLQQAYHDLLTESQHDSVMGEPLALAVYQLVTKHNSNDTWTGTPSELLERLNTSMHIDHDSRSKAWPANAIALSKRLRTAKAALLSQQVEIVFSRGKERRITITNLDAY